MVYQVDGLGEMLFHLTHIDNIPSIFQYGILSHNAAYRHGLIRCDVSSNPVQAIREKRLDSVFARPLHDYASLYFNPMNPMLRQLLMFHRDVAILGITAKVLHRPGTVFTDGNAACTDTRFFSDPSDLARLRWDVINSREWESYDDGKRLKCAEVLVYPTVAQHEVAAIFCQAATQIERIKPKVTQRKIIVPLVVMPDFFIC
jgi:hypothetical protein